MTIYRRWAIVHKGTGSLVMPAASSLKGFRDACEKGPPGRYELLDGDVVLAVGKVKRHEMAITWKRGCIFYALGQAGAFGEVAKVEKFFAKEDA